MLLQHLEQIFPHYRLRFLGRGADCPLYSAHGGTDDFGFRRVSRAVLASCAFDRAVTRRTMVAVLYVADNVRRGTRRSSWVEAGMLPTPRLEMGDVILVAALRPLGQRSIDLVAAQVRAGRLASYDSGRDHGHGGVALNEHFRAPRQSPERSPRTIPKQLGRVGQLHPVVATIRQPSAVWAAQGHWIR